MGLRKKLFLALRVVAVTVVCGAAIPAITPARAESVRTLKWADLVPPRAAPAKPRALFSGATPLSAVTPPVQGTDAAPGADDNAPPPPFREGAWMSAPSSRRGSGPPALVKALDGQRVKIGGYVVALDFEATKISEFLLVPFVGACIHVPPPPANQIVYVKVARPFEPKGQFAPVWVTGTIQADVAFTGLADAGYTMSDSVVEIRPE
ncbi:MAG: DUF3299 domain-containing protein [Hyphomicrobiaceae bacterium]